MTYHILNNPKSKRGKTTKLLKKLHKKLKNHNVFVGSLLEIDDVDDFIKQLDENDKIVILGGDGTLHHLANKLKGKDIKQDILVTRNGGTGNDFVRSIKKGKRGFFIRINDYLKNLPTEYNNEKETVFLNSVGLGIDAYVCYLVEGSEGGKTEGNYFKSAYRAFKVSKPHTINLTIDGVETTHEKVWFSVVCNGKYFGGGMKISPKSKRLDDELEVVVVKNVGKFLLFLIFPTIYLGIHKIFKRFVKFYKGKHIIIKTDQDVHVQYDGEACYPRNKIEVHR